jgi:DNA-binding CsgD family transcriptional regulator
VRRESGSRAPPIDEVGFVAWSAASANVVRDLDRPRLPRSLVSALATLVEFRYALCLVYRRQGSPVHVCDTFPAGRAKHGLLNYVTDTYTLHPVYNAYLRGLSTGAYRMRDLAPDAYFRSEHRKGFKIRLTDAEEIGYITQDWPQGMEEVLIAMELPGQCLGEISLLKPARCGGFSDTELERLQAVAGFVEAAFRWFWKQHCGASAPRAVQPPDVEEVMARLGAGVLSPREQEVAILILRGHSTVSISLQLGISVTTVKTHRKNLYATLGIATQFELFSLFIRDFESIP